MNLSTAAERRIMHLLLAFSLILIFVPSAQAVDFNCPGGEWVVQSTCGRILCVGAYHESISVDTKKISGDCCAVGFGCSDPIQCNNSFCCGYATCESFGETGCSGGSCCTVYNQVSKWICPGCVDNDGDGHYTIGSSCASSDDCDDTNNTIHPGALEICDSKDNNCDGQTDEGFGVGASCTAGVGSCQSTGTMVCSADHTTTVCSATPGTPSAEICDNKDNDCNNVTDDLPPQSCYTGPSGTEGIGICHTGTKTCTTGQWGACAGEVTPQLELCDGIDNNCDGNKDEGCFISKGPKPEHCVDSSVNMASSNLSHSQSLFRTKNAVLPIDFELIYNSLDSDGVLGKGWSHPYNIKLVQQSSTEYMLIQSYGKHTTLVQNGSQYKPPTEAYPILTINADNTYKLTHRDNTIYNFDTTGKLTSIQDKYSNTLSFTYTGGNLTGITDSQNSDRSVSLTYSDGKVQTITDPNGNVHVFTYQNGNLTGITTQTPDPNDTDPVWAYTYKSYGYMWTKTDPRGNTVTYEYDDNDPNHRLLYTVDPEDPSLHRVLTFDPSTSTSTVTEKDGGIWIYKYDATGRLTEKRIPEGYTPQGSNQPQDYVTTYTYATTPDIKDTVTDNRGNIAEQIYYSNGNLWKLTEKSSTDPVGKTTIYTYDPTTNDILTVTDPENHQTIYTYETISGERIVKIKDPSLEETEYRYYTDGRLKHIKNPKNQITTFTYSYDSQTKRTTETITDFLGASTTRIYDISGNIIETRDQFDIPTKYEYDSLNRLKYLKDHQDNVLYTYEYYADGSLKKVTDANGNWMEYKYNYKGQVTEIKDKLGNITTYQYGGTGCSSCGGGGNNLVKITDANLKETKFEYYKNGSRKNQTSPKGLTTSFTYDPAGFMASLTDPSNAITTFAKTDLIITKTDPLGKTTVYEYDKAGKIKNVTDRNNKISHYTYTPDGVIDTITYDYPNGPVVSFLNDELDRITSMTDSLGTTSYAYDDTNRKLTVTDPNGFIVIYQYDIAGRLKELTYPDNKKVIYDYDNLNRLWTVKLDWLNPVQTTTYHYDAAGRLDYTENFNGTITDYGFDDANRLTSLVNKKTDNSVIASYSFPVLDGVGNIRESVQDEPLTPIFTSGTTSYTYNAQKTRLLSAGSDTFTYDNEGQLATGYGNTYTFDYEHRLSTISGNFNATYSYDGIGNRLKAIRSGTTTKYIYDLDGSVIAEADNSNNITKYYVHGLGLMSLVTPSDVVYNYHFNNVGSTIALTDASQNMVNKYSYDPFGVILNQEETILQPFKYVGQFGVMEETSNISKMGERYYDPKSSVFYSEDPIGFAGGDANLKRYVWNSPLTWIDPSGLEAMALPGPVPLPVYIPPSQQLTEKEKAAIVNGLWGLINPVSAFENAKAWWNYWNEDNSKDSTDDYPADPDEWTPPEGWEETCSGKETGGRHRQWEGPKGEWRRWDKEGRKGGKKRGPHWHDWKNPDGHIKPNR